MTTPKTGSPELVSSQASKEISVNEGLRRIEAGSRLYVVVDKDLNSPPGGEADGANYIVGGSPTGAWAGHPGDIAIAVGASASNGWYFIEAEEGMFAWVQDENVLYYCDLGSSPSTWTTYNPGAAIALDDLTDVDAAAPTHGQVLAFDSASGDWEPATPAGGYTDEAAQDAVGSILSDSGLAVVSYGDSPANINVDVPAAAGSDFRTGTDATKALTSDAVWDSADYVVLTPGTNVSTDMATGFNFSLAMGGNYTLDNPTNTKNGQSGDIIITQSSGGHTLAYGTNWKFAGGVDPTLSTAAGAVDVLSYKVVSSSVIIAALSKGFA